MVLHDIDKCHLHEYLESFGFLHIMYGVPQQRKRVFFVGINEKIFNENVEFPSITIKSAVRSYLCDHIFNISCAALFDDMIGAILV